jgi:hypothetical protein
LRCHLKFQFTQQFSRNDSRSGRMVPACLPLFVGGLRGQEKSRHFVLRNAKTFSSPPQPFAVLRVIVIHRLSPIDQPISFGEQLDRPVRPTIGNIFPILTTFASPVFHLQGRSTRRITDSEYQ